MKKNIFMRLACVVLVLTLLSTCVISGTFAKYVTKGSAEDNARVAKFGVVLALDGDDLFKNEYATDDTARYSGAVSVKSSDDADVVAPGTKSADDSTAFSITGTPEVAVRVDVDIDETTMKDVVLLPGTYNDWTTADTTDTFELTEAYYPVVWTLTQEGNATPLATGNLAAIKEFLDTYSATAEYAPNTDLAASFELSWAWAYGDYESDLGNDKADTLLGNIAANVETSVDASKYNLTTDYDVTVTVTQVD